MIIPGSVGFKSWWLVPMAQKKFVPLILKVSLFLKVVVGRLEHIEIHGRLHVLPIYGSGIDKRVDSRPNLRWPLCWLWSVLLGVPLV